MALSDVDAARLVELKARRDAMIGGVSVRKITHGSRSKEMSDGDADKLQAEIDRLEALATTGSSRRRGSFTFAFLR